MKRIIIIIVAIFSYNSLWAQGYQNIENIKIKVAQRDSLIVSKTLKKEALIDSLEKQVKDYRLLINAYDELISEKNASYDSLKTENDGYKNIMVSDTSIFVNIPEINDLPVCLMTHGLLIKRIGELSIKIKNIEDKIVDIQNSRYTTESKKIIIKQELESDLDVLSAIFNEIEYMDMNTLSEEQKKFYRPGLTERYNKFLSYFE